MNEKVEFTDILDFIATKFGENLVLDKSIQVEGEYSLYFPVEKERAKLYFVRTKDKIPGTVYDGSKTHLYVEVVCNPSMNYLFKEIAETFNGYLFGTEETVSPRSTLGDFVSEIKKLCTVYNKGFKKTDKEIVIELEGN
ncbi:hypothetical protein [Clostridium perfringens]|uniref:hypothetical protein n=1 Tax=Clostridium perfringens TaxID=1502 RepID=UPI0024BC33E6|nr:hypothetical protein [Clostridium perfringens]